MKPSVLPTNLAGISRINGGLRHTMMGDIWHLMVGFCRCIPVDRLRVDSAVYKRDTSSNRIPRFCSYRPVEIRELQMRSKADGPATAYHLAKNIGLPVAKPDRHLVRIAEVVGYSSVQSMCESISNLTGEKISVVDLVLWRLATVSPEYLRLFSCSL